MTAMLDASTAAALVAAVEDYRTATGAGLLAVGHDHVLLDRWCDRTVHWEKLTAAGIGGKRMRSTTIKRAAAQDADGLTGLIQNSGAYRGPYALIISRYRVTADCVARQRVSWPPTRPNASRASGGRPGRGS